LVAEISEATIAIQPHVAAEAESLRTSKATNTSTAYVYLSTRKSVMAIEPLLILLLIGGVAGFLAGTVVKGYGFGVIGNIVVGIVGAFIGSMLLPRLGLYAGGDVIGQIISATLGAIALLVIIGLVRRAA
jgi:uncharacterized membrane protein YeaQ/YmgE (transglycosylase-associated protein family)